MISCVKKINNFGVTWPLVQLKEKQSCNHFAKPEERPRVVFSRLHFYKTARVAVQLPLEALPCASVFAINQVLFGYLSPEKLFKIMKINIFWVDRTDISAKKEALVLDNRNIMTCRWLRLAGVYIRICIYTYIYSVYCFSPNLARAITSSAFIALEIKKLQCLRLVEIYRMTR